MFRARGKPDETPKLRRSLRIKKLGKRPLTKGQNPSPRYLHIKDPYKILFAFNGLQSNLVMDDFSCPFCHQSFILLSQLSFHLTFTHFRFSFKITLDEKNKCVKIFVSFNKEFDTSGFPAKMERLKKRKLKRIHNPYQMTTMFAKALKPRALSGMFSYNSYHKKFTVDERRIYMFEAMNRRRLFYHSKTWMPITPAELDEDSDVGESPWRIRLKRAVSRKICSFFIANLYFNL